MNQELIKRLREKESKMIENIDRNERTIQGKVVIIHQPAEEMPPGGAQGMIKDGVLDGVDHVVRML